MKPTQREIKNFVAYFKELGIYAYTDSVGRFIIDLNETDIGVEITADEVIFRAGLYAENHKGTKCK